MVTTLISKIENLADIKKDINYYFEMGDSDNFIKKTNEYYDLLGEVLEIICTYMGQSVRV